jgi:oxygen-dependent protoporphyrinogen oxidase
LKAFFGGAQPHLLSRHDDEVAEAIQGELRQLLKFDAEPVMRRVFRWRESYPLTTVGHLTRVKQTRDLLPPGLFLAGSSYEGIGVPDCIRQGADAANDAARTLGVHSDQQGR